MDFLLQEASLAALAWRFHRSKPMAVRHLTPIPSNSTGAELYDLSRGPETTAQRVRRLQQEARILAREQVEALARDFNALAVRAAEIAEGGDAYPAGVRELASRIAADVPQKVQNLMSIMDRTAQN
jgi:hypothetical protein